MDEAWTCSTPKRTSNSEVRMSEDSRKREAGQVTKGRRAGVLRSWGENHFLNRRGFDRYCEMGSRRSTGLLRRGRRDGPPVRRSFLVNLRPLWLSQHSMRLVVQGPSQSLSVHQLSEIKPFTQLPRTAICEMAIAKAKSETFAPTDKAPVCSSPAVSEKVESQQII